jgi:hypothetical protein
MVGMHSQQIPGQIRELRRAIIMKQHYPRASGNNIAVAGNLRIPAITGPEWPAASRDARKKGLGCRNCDRRVHATNSSPQLEKSVQIQSPLCQFRRNKGGWDDAVAREWILVPRMGTTRLRLGAGKYHAPGIAKRLILRCVGGLSRGLHRRSPHSPLAFRVRLETWLEMLVGQA